MLEGGWNGCHTNLLQSFQLTDVSEAEFTSSVAQADTGSIIRSAFFSFVVPPKTVALLEHVAGADCLMQSAIKKGDEACQKLWRVQQLLVLSLSSFWLPWLCF